MWTDVKQFQQLQVPTVYQRFEDVTPSTELVSGQQIGGGCVVASTAISRGVPCATNY